MTAEELYPAAESVARLVRRFGWDVDDCRQQTWLLFRQPGFVARLAAVPAAERGRYAAVAVRYHILRVARGGYSDALTNCDLAEVVSSGRDAALIELNDLLLSAPADIGEYLTLRVLDRQTWETTRVALGLTNDSLSRLKGRSATWLLDQYEGGRP